MMQSLQQPAGREARRVHRTAKVFDDYRPDWYRRVNVTTLDLSSWRHCVLGQTYGPDWCGIPRAMYWRITLGGNLHALGLVGDPQNERLRTAWRYEIDVRLRTDRMRDVLAAMNAAGERVAALALR